jgi:two-component system copper resistance phosphate regulon response regulator CusR
MRVLLVEDEARVARFVARGLREQSYAVDVVADGEAALYQASVATYDVVVLDVMIPKVNGLEVCRALRAAGIATPVLMLTARDAVEDRIEGLDAGADDYLTKPFAFGELLARLRALLRRGADVRPETVVVADLTVDTRAHRVTRAGRTVHLTAKEYALLEYLARNAGRVVGRHEIAEHVWDERYDPFTNLIEVYIGRLRRKVDGPSDVPLIRTRRGTGYVLAADDGEAADDR